MEDFVDECHDKGYTWRHSKQCVVHNMKVAWDSGLEVGIRHRLYTYILKRLFIILLDSFQLKWLRLVCRMVTIDGV